MDDNWPTDTGEYELMDPVETFDCGHCLPWWNKFGLARCLWCSPPPYPKEVAEYVNRKNRERQATG